MLKKKNQTKILTALCALNHRCLNSSIATHCRNPNISATYATLRKWRNLFRRHNLHHRHRLRNQNDAEDRRNQLWHNLWFLLYL